ncbi:MAG: hypothetical protein GWM90_24325, partial [Gemmatimonadetes bacterium]|nr:hypothetical protein [Gemmatimonadota bacterium]NIQ57879.1 hypothetical protein [Gemmatimonadota bacterium]NIU78036.1 hypothetical protein [Gammaproteobacteria bacterium]NIX47090.1 hypothetical protein [Gemmatimonadota bacterium]NIY11470.1 hypothetical protein [Gemmatimonadota bacterium]
MTAPLPRTLRRATGLLFVLAIGGATLCTSAAAAQQWLHDDGSETNRSMFRPIEQWPDPNEYRNAAGA